MGGGSFQPDPLDTPGVNPGPGWSGTCPWGGGAPGAAWLYAGVNIVGWDGAGSEYGVGAWGCMN